MYTCPDCGKHIMDATPTPERDLGIVTLREALDFLMALEAQLKDENDPTPKKYGKYGSLVPAGSIDKEKQSRVKSIDGAKQVIGELFDEYRDELKPREVK